MGKTSLRKQRTPTPPHKSNEERENRKDETISPIPVDSLDEKVLGLDDDPAIVPNQEEELTMEKLTSARSLY